MSDVIRRVGAGMDAITDRGPLSPIFRIPIGVIITVELIAFGIMVFIDTTQPSWLPSGIVSQQVFSLFCVLCGLLCLWAYKRRNKWVLIVSTAPFIMALTLTFLGIFSQALAAVTTGQTFNWRAVLSFIVYGGLYYAQMRGAELEHKHQSQ